MEWDFRHERCFSVFFLKKRFSLNIIVHDITRQRSCDSSNYGSVRVKREVCLHPSLPYKQPHLFTFHEKRDIKRKFFLSTSCYVQVQFNIRYITWKKRTFCLAQLCASRYVEPPFSLHNSTCSVCVCARRC